MLAKIIDAPVKHFQNILCVPMPILEFYFLVNYIHLKFNNEKNNNFSGFFSQIKLLQLRRMSFFSFNTFTNSV